MLSVFFCFYYGTKLTYGFVLFNYLKVQLELNGWGLYMEPRPLPVLARVLSSGTVAASRQAKLCWRTLLESHCELPGVTDWDTFLSHLFSKLTFE